MTIFRSNKVADAIRPVVLWIENKHAEPMRLMLEPWLNIFDIEPGKFAKVVALVENSLDDMQIEYHADAFVSVWCPPNTVVSLEDKR